MAKNSRPKTSRPRHFEFRWKNFRSFEDTGWIQVKPITIFVGANNSGKTSLTRPLLLMKQTMESKDTRLALKTTGPLVDVGNFRDLVFEHAPNLGVQFSLRFHFPDEKVGPKPLKPIGEYPPGEVSIELREGSEGGAIKLYRLRISDVYGRECLVRTLQGTKNYSLVFGRPMDRSLKKLVLESRPSHFLFPSAELLRGMIQKAEERKTKKGRKTTLQISGGGALYIGLLNFVEIHLGRLLSRLSYVGPLREHPRRFYESTDEMPQYVGIRGQNTPQIMCLEKDRLFRREVGLWLSKFGLADSVSCKPLGEDLFSMHAHEPGISYDIRYADAGFGLSQLLPLIVQGFHAAPRSVVFLEQPEIHLNPRLQAQLSNLLAAITKRNLTVIVETHSEHLVSRIRTLIAKNELQAEDVALYYVEKEKGKSSVRQIVISQDGYIEPEHWPKGFFEDSLGEALQLARLPKS